MVHCNEISRDVLGRHDFGSVKQDWERFIAEQIDAGAPNLFENLVADVKRKLLQCALSRSDGNQVHAAKLLGITRSTLRNEIRKLGITIDRSVSS